jgi:hypothetical protein
MIRAQLPEAVLWFHAVPPRPGSEILGFAGSNFHVLRAPFSAHRLLREEGGASISFGGKERGRSSAIDSRTCVC